VHITGVILAGGLGRRMGGTDKGLIPFAGATLIEQVIARVTPQVNTLFLNTPNEEYARFGLPLLADAIPGRIGPLAGILAALDNGRGLVLSVPCDVPHLPPDLVSRLVSAMTPDAEVCCVHDGSRLHPVIALWHPAVAPRLRSYLERGGRRVQDFVESLRNQRADFSDCAPCFANLNTPDDLQRLEKGP